jgi:hypothetical protein
MTGPLGGGVGESESAHYQRLETSMACLLGGATEGSRSAYHQSFRKHQWWAPWKVPPKDLGASIIIIKKYRRWAPWWVLTEIRERPSSTFKKH